MQLTLKRLWFTDESTQGELYIDGAFQCYTLELPNKDGLPGSCIPQGTYKIELQSSPKFELSTDPWVQQYAKQMPHLVGIPRRSLIMIHWLNTPEETEGCIGVGESYSTNFIGESRAAFEALFPKIATSEGCSIAIIGGAIVQPADLSLEGDV